MNTHENQNERQKAYERMVERDERVFELHRKHGGTIAMARVREQEERLTTGEEDG